MVDHRIPNNGSGQFGFWRWPDRGPVIKFSPMQPNQRWIWAVVAVAFASCPVGAEAVDSIAATVRPIVAQREISGAVTLLAGGADMLHFSAVGEADLASHRPMKRDDARKAFQTAAAVFAVPHHPPAAK